MIQSLSSSSISFPIEKLNIATFISLYLETYFFSSNFHVVFDVSKYRWLNEVALAANTITASNASSTSFLAMFYVPQNFVKHCFVDLRME